MKKILVLAVACALVSGAALAVWNAQDVVPAATLLVPYAVVAVNPATNVPDPTGITTLFAMINTSSLAQLVHITVWNATSIPVVDWDVLLTGYDVWTINFADMLNGDFQKFDTTQGAFGAVANHSYTPSAYGPSANYSATALTTAGFWGTNGTAPNRVFASLGTDCRMPYGSQASIAPTIRNNIRAGQPSLGEQYYNCGTIQPQWQANTTWTSNLSNAPLFFYVTADVVRLCTQAFQNTTSYWTAVSGLGINDSYNVLTGDILYFDPTHNYSEMINAVHLEAYPAAATMTGIRTFYDFDLHDAYAGGWDGTALNLAVTAVDDREPLGRSYAFRYATLPTNIYTEAIVWKSTFEWAYDADGYTWAYGCTPYFYYAWNEDELTKSTTGGPSGFSIVQPNAIPFETQAVPLTLANFPGLVTVQSGAKAAANAGSAFGAAGFGWVWITFDGGNFTDDDLNDIPAVNYYEAWVGVRFVFGTYSAATEATLMSTQWNFGRQNNLTLMGYGAHVVGAMGPTNE